jgi:hypothetical protein
VAVAQRIRARSVTAVIASVAIALALLGLSSVLSPGTTAASASPAPTNLGVTPTSNMPLVDLVATPGGQGYWMVASDGGIFAFGNAQFYGSTGAIHLNRPIVGMAATPDGHGYWLVASDGGIFAFGDAQFYGSTGAMRLNQPIVGMAATPSGHGYWLVASDGGIFSFGDASFHGSTGAMRLNQPIVGMGATAGAHGYWLVASDGGIFSFGDASFHGSTGAMRLNQPITGVAPTPSNSGYWLVASDGGIFSFGDAQYYGSTGGAPLATPTVAVTAHQPGTGYWTLSRAGDVSNFGGAPSFGSVTYTVSTGSPAANIPPSPNFLGACYPHNTSAPCLSQIEQATTSARAAEGLGPMVLPGDFASLTPAEQLFVITDIERVDRGLPPILGLVNEFDADAQSAAQSNADPTPTVVPSGTHVTTWASIWAENGNPLGSNYFWMYDDGVGSGNVDCTTAGQSGCWGHRNNILGLTAYQTTYGGNLLMGAAEAYGTSGNGWASDAELLVLATGAMPPLTYSWAQAVAAGAQ